MIEKEIDTAKMLRVRTKDGKVEYPRQIYAFTV